AGCRSLRRIGDPRAICRHLRTIDCGVGVKAQTASQCISGLRLDAAISDSAEVGEYCLAAAGDSGDEVREVDHVPVERKGEPARLKRGTCLVIPGSFRL